MDPGAVLRKRLWEPLAEHLGDVNVCSGLAGWPAERPSVGRPARLKSEALSWHTNMRLPSFPSQLLPELLRGQPRSANEPPSRTGWRHRLRAA